MNLFANIFNQQTQDAFSQTGQALKKSFQPLTDIGTQVSQPIQKAFSPVYDTAKKAISPISNVVETIAKPIAKSIDYNNRTQAYYKPFKSEIEKIGITYDDLAELPEEEKQQVVSQLKNMGVAIPGMMEAEQAIVQEQAKQGPDLGIMGSIGEGIIGGARVGEQIPRYTGNLLNLTQKYVTTPLIAGGADLLGADQFANKWRSAGERFGEGAKGIGEDITRAGEGNITENQREARRFGASMVATSPIPLGTASKFVQGAGLAKTALRGGIAGAIGTPVYTGLEEGRLPTATEQAIGTVGGAVLGTALEKVAIPGIQKGIESVQKKINPSKFTQQIDNETIKLVRQAIRPSTSGVDTANKFDIQDAKLLQGVKEVVKQGKSPKTAKDLMQAIQNTKQSIWSKVEQANKAVVKTTTGDEIATKLRTFVSDPENKTTFLSRPELKENLLRYADEVQANKDFANISQQELQEVLTDINSRIPAGSFLKQLDANPTQTAQNTVISKIYRDIIDDNLENAVGSAGKEARQAYGSVRQLEKDFAKRYGVYLRQNPKGLADMFGMEGFADMAVGLLTSSPGQVARGAIIQGAKKLIKNANNPDTIIRDIFKLQSKVKPNISKNANIPTGSSSISPMANTNTAKANKGQALALPAPSGKPLSANIVNVKPILVPKKYTGIIRDPRVQARNDYLELKSLEESLTKGDEAMKSKARTALNRKIEQMKVDFANRKSDRVNQAKYEEAYKAEQKQMERDRINARYSENIYGDSLTKAFNDLKRLNEKHSKGGLDLIELNSQKSVIRKRFVDNGNDYLYRTNEGSSTNKTIEELYDEMNSKGGKLSVSLKPRSIIKPKPLSNESKVIKPGIGSGNSYIDMFSKNEPYDAKTSSFIDKIKGTPEAKGFFSELERTKNPRFKFRDSQDKGMELVLDLGEQEMIFMGLSKNGILNEATKFLKKKYGGVSEKWDGKPKIENIVQQRDAYSYSENEVQNMIKLAKERAKKLK